jgi:hypothetical protein
VVLLGSATVGCGGNGPPPGPIRFRAQAAGVAFESTSPAFVDVALGSTASVFELHASAGSDRGIWRVRVTLTREQTLAGIASVTVGTSELGPANVQITGSRPLIAEIGMVDVSFGQGTTSGTVTGTSPELLDGTFSGELLPSCWVPPSALAGAGPADGGATVDAGTETLVLDDKFVSAPCRPFQGLQ